MSGENCIVIDSGSGEVKCGFAGDDAPRSIFPNIIGKGDTMSINGVVEKEFVGDDAQSKRSTLSIRHPIEHGVVSNYDDMQKIWEYTFYNPLSVPPMDARVILSEAPLTPKINRDKTAEIMFECLSVPYICFCNSSVLALYSYGRTTGLVIDSGYASTTAVPVYEGHSINFNTGCMDIAGIDITNYLCKLSNSTNFQLYNEIKEKIAFVAMDTTQLHTTTFNLPDGRQLTIGDEAFQCAEILFNPKLAGMEIPGISALAQEAILKCDEEIKTTLYKNIALCGGTSMLRGMEARLQKELPTSTVVTMPERKYAAWLGGSILGSLTHCWSKLYVSRKEWQENPAIVHRFFW